MDTLQLASKTTQDEETEIEFLRKLNWALLGVITEVALLYNKTNNRPYNSSMIMKMYDGEAKYRCHMESVFNEKNGQGMRIQLEEIENHKQH